MDKCQYIISLFQISIAKESHKHFEDLYRLKGYKRKDHQFCAFQNYNLTYTMYTRPIIQEMWSGSLPIEVQNVDSVWTQCSLCSCSGKLPLYFCSIRLAFNISIYLFVTMCVYYVHLWGTSKTRKKYHLRFNFNCQKPR